MTSRQGSRRVFVHVLVGILMVQAAWILALPAFRGIDEFDHVFKAAAVARGEWTSSGQAPQGRGGLVRIPGDLVSAASAVCRSYTYTKPDDCVPVRRFPGGDVEIASAASAYNPAYYAVVGTLTRPFHGAQADYAMRAVTALACAWLLAWAATIVVRWSRSRWPLVVFMLGLTPVLLYSTAIASPNGLAYSGAALLWVSLLSVVRRKAATALEAVGAGTGAVALMTTHGTGPMLAFLALALVLLLQPSRTWRILVVSRWKVWLPVATTVLLVALGCVAWIGYAHPGAIGEPADSPLTVTDLLTFEVLWLLEAVAVFPTVTEFPHPVVYALWGVPLLAMLVQVLRTARGRVLVTAVGLLVLLVTIPAAFTLATYADTGLAWQGRYSLPLWLGLSSVAALLAASRREAAPTWVPLVYGMAATAVAVSVIQVGFREAHGELPSAVAARLPGGLVLVGVLAAVGTLLPLALPRRLLGEGSSGPAHDRVATQGSELGDTQLPGHTERIGDPTLDAR